MEKTIYKTRSDRTGYGKFLQAWKKAGFPRHFRTNGNFQRIWDSAALREQLDQRGETPEERQSRLMQVQNEWKYRRLNS